jgi:hypothetical protein
MRGCVAYALPTNEEADFVETFGIALTKKLLAGGGPVITTLTGGKGEAVGDTAVIVPAADVAALTAALDRVVLEVPEHERRASSGVAATTPWPSTAAGCSTTCSARTSRSRRWLRSSCGRRSRPSCRGDDLLGRVPVGGVRRHE